jgi:hypothetical protein
MVGMLGCYVIRRSRGCHRVTETQGPQLGRLDLGRDVFRLVAFLMVPVVVGPRRVMACSSWPVRPVRQESLRLHNKARVAARYQSILEEYCTTGDVDCLGYDYFDAPDSPVPIFGAEFDMLVREMAESASNEGVRDGAPISEGDSVRPVIIQSTGVYRFDYNILIGPCSCET